jgi:hypothetical protein
MLAQDKKKYEELYKEILIKCPICETKNKLKMPYKIINQSKQLTTISIPSGLICNHSFQAFIDKNFKIRGYQKIDFEFSKMEFYEGTVGDLDSEQETEEEINNLTSLPLFQDIIKLLRSYVDDKEILGTAICTVEGKVLYSSLPHSTLLNTIKEFEVRNEQSLISVKKMYLELENNQKVCSVYMKIYSIKFILVMIFSSKVKLGMGNLLLRELVKKIEKLT